MIYVGYALLISTLSIYSYALVDPNFTLISHSAWEAFRNWIIPLGYYHRPQSLLLFAILTTCLFAYQYLWLTRPSPSLPVREAGLRGASPWKVALLVSCITLFAYPFLSHDFFNYLFDAKIFTFYHRNPYLHTALDFPQDEWVRFMHWTHRTYPYGPVFLGITFIPSFLSFGKFAIDFFLFKALWGSFFVTAIYLLQKKDEKTALFIATSPFVIIEGLINNHNDVIALMLGLIALSLMRKKIVSLLWWTLSVLIKYTSLPFALLVLPGKWPVYASTFLFGSLIVYMKFIVGMQPWYFLNLFLILPRWKESRLALSVLSIFLLLSHYPYILFGDWTAKTVQIREYSIMIGMALFYALLILKTSTISRNGSVPLKR